MSDTRDSLTIGTLARACGVSPPTVRYYEKIGLLPKAERTRADQRRYSASDVERLRFIRRSREFGFSTKQVRALIAIPTGTATDCDVSRRIAQERITDIRAKIADLLLLEQDLNALIDTCDATCAGQKDQTCCAFENMSAAGGAISATN